MTFPIYTAGYNGHTLKELVKIAENLNALVFDIRYAPASVYSDWRRSTLEEELGEQYLWFPQFGNLFYKGEHVTLSDWQGGFEEFLFTINYLSVDCAILLCVCENPVTCHRSKLTSLFLAQKHPDYAFEVDELDWNEAYTFKGEPLEYSNTAKREPRRYSKRHGIKLCR